MKKILILFIASLNFNTLPMQLRSLRPVRRLINPALRNHILRKNLTNGLRFQKNSQTSLLSANQFDPNKIVTRPFFKLFKKFGQKSRKSQIKQIPYSFQIFERFQTQNNKEILLDFWFCFNSVEISNDSKFTEIREAIFSFIKNFINSNELNDLNEEILNKAIENSNLAKNLDITITKLSCKITTKEEAEKAIAENQDKISKFKEPRIYLPPAPYKSNDSSDNFWLNYWIMYNVVILPQMNQQIDYYHYHSCSHRTHDDDNSRDKNDSYNNNYDQMHNNHVSYDTKSDDFNTSSYSDSGSSWSSTDSGSSYSDSGSSNNSW